MVKDRSEHVINGDEDDHGWGVDTIPRQQEASRWNMPPGAESAGREVSKVASLAGGAAVASELEGTRPELHVVETGETDTSSH